MDGQQRPTTSESSHGGPSWPAGASPFGSGRDTSTTPPGAMERSSDGGNYGGAAGVRPMTAPEMMLPPSSFLHGSYGSMPPALFHAQEHLHHNGHQQQSVPSSTPSENGHLVAPVPQRARNMSMPDNGLLMLPDEPGQSSSHRPATSGGFPSSHHHSMPPQASLPPTLAAMPGYAYGAAMLANSNARKAALAAQQSQFAAAAQQQPPQSMYPFSHDPFNNPQSANMTDDGASTSSRPNTANRPDTASSFTSTSTVGTTDQQQVGTTAIGVDGRLYRFVGVQAQHKKRARRRYDEIERMYNCNYPGCTKAYGCLNHLNAHVAAQKHGPKRLPAEFKEMRREWRAKKKAEEQHKRREQEDAAENGEDTDTPPHTGGPVIPPAADTLFSQPQLSNVIAQPVSASGPLPQHPLQPHAALAPAMGPPPGSSDGSNVFAFQPPPISQHPFVPPPPADMHHFFSDPHQAAAAAMRPATAPSQFAFQPPFPPAHAMPPGAPMSVSRPSSSSVFSFEVPEASEALQSFGSIAGRSPSTGSPSASGPGGGPSMSPSAGGTPPMSMADRRRMSFHMPPPGGMSMGGLDGIPEHPGVSMPSDYSGQGSAASHAWYEGGTPQSHEDGSAHSHSATVPGLF